MPFFFAECGGHGRGEGEEKGEVEAVGLQD